MRKHRLIVGLLLLVAMAGAVQAATGDELLALSLEELASIKVNIATGTPTSLPKTPAATTVITAKDLEALASQDLVEALEAVPGLHVSRGSVLYAPRYFIRGITSQYNPQTLVLVNGIPMTGLSLGAGLGLNYGLPVKTIRLVDRIEIIRGPGSAVHGADAFAGVINIITKRPEDVQGGRASLSHGSFDTTRATLQQGGRLGEMHAAVALAYAGTNGPDSIITADAQTGLDALGLAPPASLAPGSVNRGAKDFEVRLDLGWDDFLLRTAYAKVWDAGTGQGDAEALDPVGRWEDERASVDLSWSPAPVGAWEIDTQVSYLYTMNGASTPTRLFPTGANFGTGPFPEGVQNQPGGREENLRLGFAAVYTGWESHRLRLGSGFHWGDLYEVRAIANYDFSGGVAMPRPGGMTDLSDTPATFLPEAQRTSHYGFIQDEWAFAPDWELTAGLRHDHYSDVGDTTNPRLALVWTTAPWLTSKLLYGEAFRPPAFIELYARNNPIGQGNPNLEPEKLKSTELVFTLTPSAAWAWDINLYHFRIRDFIDFMQDGSGTFTAQNAGCIRGHGLETEVRYQPSSSLQLLANYSYQHTEDERTGEPLGLAPRDKFFARAIWNFRSQWQLTPQLTWVDERQRQAGDPRPALGGYTTLDLTLRRINLVDRYSLALIGRNLFDADVREPSRGPAPGQTAPTIPNDLPQAGRSVMVEASVRW